MGVPDNYLKLEAVNNYLQTVELINYTQFTRDFVENWVYREEIKEKLKDTVLALSYEVVNILEIMNPTIGDYQFFVELKQIIGEV
jgi:hypothetical protein